MANTAGTQAEAQHTPMNAHGTPGPFVVREEKRHDDESRITIRASTGMVLAELSNYNSAERRTLARQFAAAPEMLAALEAFLRAPSVGSSGPGSSTIVVQDFNLRAARAAIAKVTGSAS